MGSTGNMDSRKVRFDIILNSQILMACELPGTFQYPFPLSLKYTQNIGSCYRMWNL